MRSVLFVMVLSGVMMACGGSKSTTTQKARIPNCETIEVDMEKGTIEGFALSKDPLSFKAQFPCHTRDTTFTCGTMQIYREHGFAFLPAKDALILYDNFRGRPSAPAISLGTQEASKYYGEPVRTFTEDGKRVQVYAREYGSLILIFNDRDKAEQVQLHSTGPEDVRPCL